MAVADRDQHADQDEESEQDARQDLHAATSMACWGRATPVARLRLLLVAWRFGRREACGARGFLVEPVAQILARLEVGHPLGCHGHLLAGARIAAGPRFALLHRECTEAAQFHAVATGQGL